MNKVAETLLKIKAVALNTEKPFTWASGIKSPIYTDNRKIISHPEARKIVETTLAKVIQRKFKGSEAIVGTSTAGIPHAAYVSQILNLPMAYVRSKAKDHGLAKLIEGDLKPRIKVVVVEDLFSTGNSSLEVVKILRAAGFQVLGVVSIFSYDLTKCYQSFAKIKCPIISLCTIKDLLITAKHLKYLNEKQTKVVAEFQKKLNKN